MQQSHHQTGVQLPENLASRFLALRQKLLRVESLLFFGSILNAFLLSWLLLFISDRVWETPQWLRWTFLLAALVAGGWFGLAWARQWVLHPRTTEDLARLVQSRFKVLGDRLLGIVELAHQERRPPGFSEELYRAAIRQVATEAEKYEFTQAVNTRQLQRPGSLLFALFGAVLLLALLVPGVALNAFRRWIMPSANLTRETLVELKALPRELIVPHGEEFQVTGEVAYRSFWKPAKVTARFEKDLPQRGETRQQQVKVNVSGKTVAGKLRIALGDATHLIDIKPIHRPALKGMTVDIELPEYLHYPSATQAVSLGNLVALEGSKIRLTGTATRQLASAAMHLPELAPADLSIRSNEFNTQHIVPGAISSAIFEWRDSYGLSNAAPWKLNIETQVDAAPQPEIKELPRNVAVLESEVLQMVVQGRDDYGLQSIGLNWSLDNGSSNTLGSALRFDSQGYQEKTLEHTFTLTPAILGIPKNSTITVKAFAHDFYPGREPMESGAYRIQVVGQEEHAEMIRQRLESLLVRLEEVTRAEEKIAAQTDALLKNQEEDPAKRERSIEDLEQQQRDNAENLSEMSREGMKTLREALRNPAFSEELLEKWTKNLHQMQQLAAKEMAQAAKELKEAKNGSKSEQQQDLASAKEQEEEALNALKEIQQRINEGLDDLQAMTLAQRLRKLGGNQKEIEAALQKNIGETIGLTTPELPAGLAQENKSLAEQQGDTRKEADTLQTEISRFFERTRKEGYGKVSREMAAVKTSEELEKIRTFITDNVSMEAMNGLAHWSDQFAKWADLLQPPPAESSSNGSGEGEGGGEQQDSALKQLMALLRMRENQVNLRERTRLLEQQKDNNPMYRERVYNIQEAQDQNLQKLQTLADENPFKILAPSLEESSNAMGEVWNFLDEPRTDEATIKLHNEALANLSDAINLLNEEQQKQQQQGKGNQASKPSEGNEMQFLMQMMAMQPKGMQPSNKPGGNNMGGDTDNAGEGPGGTNTGNADEDRTVQKASGTTRPVPAEFRDALESYYKALEAEQQ
ncbi:MAG: hypothetical protein SFY81_17030 [Verrucomicrobiota bacterium]|nr:hypothetical protein [Verrucomicrobiota bacterium]